MLILFTQFPIDSQPLCDAHSTLDSTYRGSELQQGHCLCGGARCFQRQTVLPDSHHLCWDRTTGCSRTAMLSWASTLNFWTVLERFARYVRGETTDYSGSFYSLLPHLFVTIMNGENVSIPQKFVLCMTEAFWRLGVDMGNTGGWSQSLMHVS